MDWSSSSFQIITAVIGSGVLLFVLQTASTDFNQPHLVFIESNPHVNQYRTTLMNDGRSPATNVRLTLVYFDNNTGETNSITGFTAKTKTENFTLIQEDQRTLIANIPRLTRGASISILTNTSTPATFAASATSDQGTHVAASEKIYLAKKEIPFFVASRDFVPFSSRIIMILLIFSTIFLSASLYKRIRQLATNDASEFVSKVRKEIKSINDTLKKNMLSKSIFSPEVWTSIDDDYKRKTFNDYEDYKKIDAFYRHLKERENNLLNNPVTPEMLSRYNQELAGLVTDLSTRISNYAKRYRARKLIIIFSVIGTIIFGSLIVMYIFLQLGYYELKVIFG